MHLFFIFFPHFHIHAQFLLGVGAGLKLPDFLVVSGIQGRYANRYWIVASGFREFVENQAEGHTLSDEPW